MHTISVSDIVRYAQRRGWTSVQPYKRGIRVLHDPYAEAGDPLEIVLPLDDRDHASDMYMQSALALLAALEDRTPAALVHAIRCERLVLLQAWIAAEEYEDQRP